MFDGSNLLFPEVSTSSYSASSSSERELKRRRTNSGEKAHDQNIQKLATQKLLCAGGESSLECGRIHASLPTGLPPELVSLCSSASDNEQLVSRLAEDPLNLTAFFEAATSDREWYQTHIDVSQNIVSKISALTPENEELLNRVDRICTLMHTRVPQGPKSGFDIAFSMLKNLKDMLMVKLGVSKYYEPIDPSVLPELTKLAIAAKDETLTKSCLELLQERYGVPLSLHGLRQIDIKINSNAVDPEKIRTLLSDLGDRLPIVFDISPCADFNITTLQQLIPICKGKIVVLNLNNLGNSITQDQVNDCVSNEPNLNYLSLSSNNLTHLDLKHLQSLSVVSIHGCSHIEHVSMDFLPNLLEIRFPLFNNESIQEITLNHLNSLRELNLSSLHGLKTLSVTSLPELADITMPARPELKDITLEDNGKLLELNLSNLNLKKLDLKGSFENIRFSHTSFSDACFESFVEQLPTWTRLKHINLAGSMYQERFNRLVPHLERLRGLQLERLIPPTGAIVPESLRSIFFPGTLFDGLVNLPNIAQLTFENANSLTDIDIEHLVSFTNRISIITPTFTTVSVTCNREKIEPEFVDYLSNLKQKLTPESKKLKVSFENEQGLDDGGLSREFITLIFSLVEEKLLTLGAPNFEKSQYSLKIDADTAEKVFEAVGTVLGFILKTAQSYPIGRVFSIEFFEFLKNNSKNTLDKAYADLSIAELMLLSSPAFHNSPKLPLFSKLVTESSLPKDAAILQEILNLYKASDRDPPDLSNFEALKEEVRKILLEQCESEIRPMCAIAKEFHKMVGDVSHLDVEAIQQKVQGVSSAQLILDALEYTNNVPLKLQTALKNWITNAKPEKLHDFLQFLGGSKTLPAGQKILIQGVLGDYFFGHSCGFQLDVPIAMDGVDLAAMLNGLAEGQQGFGAY